MPDLERECMIWCPKCRKDKFTVLRQPTGQTGVYQNVTTGDLTPFCVDCGGTLERRPA